MARSHNRDPSITQANGKKGISPKRGMSARAKRHSNKVDRQLLKKDLAERETVL
jgi:hypothetical protein